MDQIRLMYERLRRSERKVADCILLNPEVALGMNISALAKASKVSDPTVLRFCRGIGFSGFHAFKLSLAQSLVGNVPYVRQGIFASDSIKSLATVICTQSATAILELSKEVNWDEVNLCIDCLSVARRIEFHGVGASGAVIMDAQHKFFRLNIPVSAYVDPHMQLMSASGMKSGDVLLSFSYTGRSKEIFTAAEIARKQGAKVIAVTIANTPLAKIADYKILLPMIEDTEQYTPMTSRLLQLVIVDILETALALRQGEDLIPHLQKIKDILSLSRIPNA